ncbi:Bicoid-interacting protein 3-domain-containing protein [Xylariales sp. PMI_506]|nr:Bicoid-interacting protein 3-domain-containing protein [Xylariales sp. PMI_506]
MSETSRTLSPSGAQELSRPDRFRATHLAARHGNYHQYYTKFRAPTIPDERLSILLSSNILREARVLDLGCNAGKLTDEVMVHCGASASVGVDIDPWLVEQAKAAYPNGPCTFEHFDFTDAAAYTGTALGKFDVVLLLSVTKWVHLNSGDAGMLALFAHIYDILNDGGHLVVEPQPMSNYVRAVKKNKQLRDIYKTIKIQPPFADELRAQGFERVLEVERDEEGFARPVHVWRKISAKGNSATL